MGRCLVSQDIRELIHQGQIQTPQTNLENRIQPASFEPVIGDGAYILRMDHNDVFRPDARKTVHALLKQTSSERISLQNGYELRSGCTYLIPCEDTVRLRRDRVIKCSPKSSIGRLFPVTRVVADYAPLFDVIDGGSSLAKNETRDIRPWIVIQPTVFGMVVHPGTTLTQLRIFKGDDASLSQSQIRKLHAETPLIYQRTQKGKWAVRDPYITNDGLHVGIDISGKYTHGISALRARRTPEPIDITKRGAYDAHTYFVPVKPRNNRVSLAADERYLFVTNGIIHVPEQFSVEVRRHYGNGLRGIWDEAGFIDPNWFGNIVFEAVHTEGRGLSLDANDTPLVTAFEFFRNQRRPDKTYGATGSNYQGQKGIRLPKYFKQTVFA